MVNKRPKVYTVAEFNEYIDLLISRKEVVVEGEISELNIAQGRWIFATIKDKNASCEVFAYVEQITTLPVLEAGMLVHVYGRPRLYLKTGRFRIWAEHILPTGEGALRLAFEKLKKLLEKEGLFSVERKRPLPSFPEKIGLITAKNSSAYSDFIKVLGERFGGLTVYFWLANKTAFCKSSIVFIFPFWQRFKIVSTAILAATSPPNNPPIPSATPKTAKFLP